MPFLAHAPNKYAAAGPYPEIKVVSSNPYYAELLMDDYAGFASEFTAITQYLYHHYIIKNKKIAELLEGIAITEMHHMELLAETIVLLGGEPRIRGAFSTWGHYWNGCYIKYGTSVYDQLQADIEAEKQAIANYRYRIMQIDDPYIQKLLERVIQDEELHLVLFQEALRELPCLNKQSIVR